MQKNTEIANLTELYQAQKEEIADLKDKVARLSEDISFNAVVTCHNILDDSSTVFDIVRHNNGNGYDSHTGEPPPPPPPPPLRLWGMYI